MKTLPNAAITDQTEFAVLVSFQARPIGTTKPHLVYTTSAWFPKRAVVVGIDCIQVDEELLAERFARWNRGAEFPSEAVIGQ